MTRTALAVCVIAGCLPPSGSGGGSPSSGMGPPIPTSDGYAAMDDVPVAGGELRLADPIESILPDGAAAQAIAFPLRHTAVTVDVAGMNALYAVEQTFENPYDEPIEAVYVFPLGDEAAITRYRITIGDRTIDGEIAKKADARKTYDDARAAGHTAGLLEQHKRNVFEQRIANIAPREAIRVRFEYVELLDYADGQYEIAFPLVVGPRYLPADGGRSPIGSKHHGSDDRPGETAIPYVDSKLVDSTVSFTAEVDAGVPVLGVSSPSHDVSVQELAPTKRKITLARTAEIPNRDLVVRYRTANEQTMVGVLSHRTAKTGYFTLIVQPKAEYKTGDITGREVVVVIDTSGSMDGTPIEQAKALASMLVDSLTDKDTFNVIGFSGSINPMREQPIAGDAAGKKHGKEFIATMYSGGGTEMGPAMARSLATDPGRDRIRLVYFLTDGYVGNDDVIVSAARTHLGHNRIYPIGIGSAPNRSLLNQLAAVGRGFPSYLALNEKADEVGAVLVRRSAFPYLTDVEIEWGRLAVGAVSPQRIPDVYAGMPLIVAGKYTKPGSATVTVKATTGGRRVSIPVTVTLPAKVDREPVAALWARRRIDDVIAMAGEQRGDAVEKEVTALGLEFHMVTEYTSFVAVDRSRVVAPGGKARTVEQPAASPEGVNIATAVEDDSSSQYGNHSSGGRSSSSDDGDWGGGGGYGGGGDVDWLTILLALAFAPLAWTLRRVRAA